MQKHEQEFLALLKPHHDRLARFARAMTTSREDAEDLVSDTLLIAFEHFGDLRDSQAFLGWLFSIASRLQKRRRWKARLFQRFTTFDDDGSDTLNTYEEQRTNSPETLVDVELLYEALEKLPHKHREAFVLFEVSGFSLAEIQEVQGGSLSAVKMRLVRAREQLRELLGEERTTTTAPKKEATIHTLPASEQGQTKLSNI